MATTVLVAGRAIAMTMMKGMTVQATSAEVFVEGGGLVAAGFAVRPDGVEHHPKTPMKITIQIVSSIQCSHMTSRAI